MKTRKLELRCPVCGSGEVYYSCTPNCCFNHVCANCGSTFEPVTKGLGGTVLGIVPPDAPPEGGDPAVACAVCDSTQVYVMEDESLVCAKCGARLLLEFTEISPG